MHADNDNDDIQAKIVLSFLRLLYMKISRIAITDSWWALACVRVSFLQLQTPWMGHIQELYDKPQSQTFRYIFTIILIVSSSVLLYHRHAKTNSKESTIVSILYEIFMPHTLFY